MTKINIHFQKQNPLKQMKIIIVSKIEKKSYLIVMIQIMKIFINFWQKKMQIKTMKICFIY